MWKRTGTTQPKERVNVPKVERIPISELGLPEPYIRKATNNERINMWVEQIKEVIQQTSPENPGAWFLPPVHVMRLAKPQVVKYTGADKKKHEKEIKYRILDGVHRRLTRELCGWDSIDANVHDPMSPAQAYAFQYKVNNDGPLPFDKETRDRAIRQLVAFKNDDGSQSLTLAQIGIQTGLSESQISRISAGKSRTQTPEEVGEARKRTGKKGKGKASPGGYAAKDFFDGIKRVAREATTHKKALREYLGEHDSAWEPCQDLITVLEALREDEKG